ncbi:DUF1707 SHOCT-like domain-containing protein [Herbidospora sp. RD11066]
MQHIRVSDVERDRACAILREHYAVGRLDDPELSTRLAAAQTAVTWGDLHELMNDLPQLPGMPLMPSVYPPPPPPPVAPYPPNAYVTYAPPVYHPPPPPPVRPPGMPDPGKAYARAATVSFILGFVSFGIMWAPALIFTVLAKRARERCQRDRNTGKVIAFVSAAAVMTALVVMPAAFHVPDDPTPGYMALPPPMEPDFETHEVGLEVVSDQPDATADNLMMSTEGETTVSGKGMRLPVERTVEVESLSEIVVEADAPKGVQMTCQITVDGEVVAEGKSKNGMCEAAYNG